MPNKNALNSMDRVKLYEAITPNKTKVRIVGGKNKGKSGVVSHKSLLNNDRYRSCRVIYYYNNYFTITINTDGKKIQAGCNNVRLSRKGNYEYNYNGK